MRKIAVGLFVLLLSLLLFQAAGGDHLGFGPEVADNERDAVLLLRAMARANHDLYASRDAYARDLQELKRAAAVETRAAAISNAYEFFYSASTNPPKFELTAVPKERLKTAIWAYFVDESGIIRRDSYRVPNRSSRELK
jgi:hypothetical protein